MSDSPFLVALKIEYKGEIHRLRVDVNSYTYEELSALFASTFTLPANSYVIQYSDSEGDVISVNSEAEFKEATKDYLSSPDTAKALRFIAQSRAQVAFQENVAEPVLKAIEKLVETLKTTMEKVKQEQWAQRAQSGVEQTGEAIKVGMGHTSEAIKVGVDHTSAAIKSGVGHTSEALTRAAKEARESLEQTGEVLNRAAQDARVSLVEAGKSIQEIQFEQVLKETSENLKAAAVQIGDFANDLVEELRKHSAHLAATVPVPVVVPVAQPSAPAATEAAAPSEPEWEQVDEQAAAPAPVEEPVVVVAEPAVEVSAEEQKWAAHIAMVRDILPAAAPRQIIDRLEQCNGNVEVVVNALMEEM